MILTLLISCSLIAFLAFRFIYRKPDHKTQLKKFPGPDGLPYIGNIVGMPVFGAVFQFKLWTDMYGPISEIKLLGQRFILVSSEKITKDLFVAKGQIISGRPCTFAVKDAQSKFGTSEYLPLMSFNEDHHRQKRIGRGVMTRSQARDNFGIPVLESQRLMILLALACEEASTSWIRLTEDMTSRVMTSVCFGSPKHAKRLHKYTWELLEWVSPNGVLPNLAIFLDKLPFYCSPWKVMEWFRHRRQQGWFREILEDTRGQMAQGLAPPSYFVDHLEASAKPSSIVQTYPSDDDASKAIGMIATAGIFTVSGPMQNFIRALVCFPEWQPKLQEELDSVVKFSDLPTVTDVAKLPLLRAFLREVIRWRQAIPSGIPHEAEEDYLYDGVLITKGSAIFASEYGMSRDPTVYTNPYTFDPTRWFNTDTNTDTLESGNDLSRYHFLTGTPMFGWGRRYCMGHELAQDDIYAFATHVIWSFDVSTPDHVLLSRNLLPGEVKGGHQWPQAREESLIIMRPERIRVKFQARDQDRMKLLNEAYARNRMANVLSRFDCDVEKPVDALQSLGITV